MDATTADVALVALLIGAVASLAFSAEDAPALSRDGAYWLRIDRLLEPLALAEVDARHLGEGRFEVAASNVAAFTLDTVRGPAPGAARVSIAIDGHHLWDRLMDSSSCSRILRLGMRGMVARRLGFVSVQVGGSIYHTSCTPAA